jgi:hypothetical protein
MKESPLNVEVIEKLPDIPEVIGIETVKKKKKSSSIRDFIIFSLIFIVILMWCYTFYLWMICCFNWNTSIYRNSLAAIVASAIVTIIAIIIVIVLSLLRK